MTASITPLRRGQAAEIADLRFWQAVEGHRAKIRELEAELNRLKQDQADERSGQLALDLDPPQVTTRPRKFSPAANALPPEGTSEIRRRPGGPFRFAHGDLGGASV